MRRKTFAAAAAAASVAALVITSCGSITRQTSLPTVTATSKAHVSTSAPSAGGQLPISVESDSQMQAAGNSGPSSSILLPTSCRLTGSTVTALGTYTNGGFVPEVYHRYGDVIVLYVFAAPSPGYPQGIQLGVSEVGGDPVVGSPAPWHVGLSVSPGPVPPARCAVAAQPTHDVQLAP